MIVICDKCGKSFADGNRETGEPNGVTLIMVNKVVTLCAECVESYNTMTPVMQQLFRLQLNEKLNERRKS